MKVFRAPGLGIGSTMVLCGILAACGSSSHGNGTAGTGGVGQGGGGSGGFGASGGGPGGSGGGGTSGSGGGINPGGGALLPFLPDSDGITLAIDSSGALHVGTLAKVDGKTNAVYARCQAQCDNEASWISVALGEAEASFPPTVAVTADGRPRIAFDVINGGAPGFYYGECDGACDNGANWKGLRVTQDLEVTGLLRPKVPFAVSPSGSAALADNDNSGSFVYYCKAGCADPGAWAKVQIGDAYLSPESITFGPDESPQVVAMQLVGQEDAQLQWFACSGDCSQQPSWGGIQGLWTTHQNHHIDAAIARTPQGGPRVLIYADDPNTPASENIYAFASCDTDCFAPTGWSIVSAPLPANSADRGFDIIVDGAGRPTIAFVSNTQIGFTTCTGDCATGPGWQPLQGIETGVLDTNFPFTLPNTCTQAYWLMQTGPSLAVTPDGKLAMAFTASQRASGGTCGTDTFVASQSFITLP